MAVASAQQFRARMRVRRQVTDFTEGLMVIDVPTLVMHSDDDQVMPIANSALRSVKLLKKGTLKVYEKLPHGMCTTHADVVNPDLLEFIRD